VIDSYCASPSTLYGHVSATVQEDAAARIDAAFRGAKMGSEGGRRGRSVAISPATTLPAFDVETKLAV
jgi:hypothetical protein